jgi:hypothetical protein
MPVFSQRVALAVRNVKAFLNLEAGVVRDRVPESGVGTQGVPGGSAVPRPSGAGQDQRIEQLRRELRGKERENARLRSRLAAGSFVLPGGGVKPENMIWMFGSGRTGSSWLSTMMGDLEGHARWNEPYVGELFGSAYYIRAGDRMRGRKDYALGDDYREAWINSIRNFVLEGANARFSDLGENGYLAIKEPNGSIGAPLLAEAFPESRMILLVRDPRDVVSSAMAAQMKGSWGEGWRASGDNGSLADTDPEEFARQWANMYTISLGNARKAYEVHKGPRVVVRYEDLRTDTLKTMRRLYSKLDIPVGEEELAGIVERHAWENVPENKKGPDKPHRKATPGGWKEDLTPEQARIVEELTVPILDEFYPEWSVPHGKAMNLEP